MRKKMVSKQLDVEKAINICVSQHRWYRNKERVDILKRFIGRITGYVPIIPTKHDTIVDGTPTRPDKPGKIQRHVTVSLTKSSFSGIGDTANVIATITPSSAGTITYKSSNTSVATVSSSGAVKIVGSGSFYITVTVSATATYDGCSGNSSTYTIGSSKKTPTITVSIPSTMSASTTASTTVKTDNIDGNKTYRSSDTSIATVSSDGTISAISDGSFSITVTVSSSSTYNSGSSISNSCTVSSSTSRKRPTFNVTIDEEDYVGKSGTTYILTQNQTVNFTVETNSDGDVTVTGNTTYFKDFSYNSETNRGSFLPYLPTSGNVYVTISVKETDTYLSTRTSFTFNINSNKIEPRTSLDVTVNGKSSRTATYGNVTEAKAFYVTPASAETTPTYYSTDTNVVQINKTSGIITVIGSGSCEIHATTVETQSFLSSDTYVDFTVYAQTPHIAFTFDGIDNSSIPISATVGTVYTMISSTDVESIPVAFKPSDDTNCTLLQTTTANTWTALFNSSGTYTISACTNSEEGKYAAAVATQVINAKNASVKYYHGTVQPTADFLANSPYSSSEPITSFTPDGLTTSDTKYYFVFPIKWGTPTILNNNRENYGFEPYTSTTSPISIPNYTVFWFYDSGDEITQLNNNKANISWE